MFGLYLHIPFCETICPYCDFCSLAPHQVSAIFTNEYITLLAREAEPQGAERPLWRGTRVETIYFGGGTPSTVAPERYAELLATLGKFFEFAPGLEVTLEANPGTLTTKKLAGYRELGITRLSLGVQSFHDDTLRILGRHHNAAQVHEAIDLVAAADFPSWSVDLMFAAPEQSASRWSKELDAFLEIGAPHASLYNLTIHEGTPYSEADRQGKLRFADEEDQRAMFYETRERLRAAGYGHYELSNFAHAGHESRHNLNYWRGGDFLGLGLSAHSSLDGDRFSVTESPEEYATALKRGELALTPLPAAKGRAASGEAMMLGLRCLEGLALEAASRRTGIDLERLYAKELRQLTEDGFLAREGDIVRLTEKGLYVADAVMRYFF